MMRAYLCAVDSNYAGVAVSLKLSCYGEKEKAKKDFHS